MPEPPPAEGLPSGEYSAAHDESVRRMNRICDDFESAYRRGDKPQLESFVSSVPPPLRASLFARLLKVEIELLKSAGEKPDSAHYRQRFPEFATVLNDCFAEQSTLAIAARRTAETDALGPAITSIMVSVPSSEPEPGERPFAPSEIKRVIGRYQVLQDIGSGSFGLVSRAWDPVTRREVAIKELTIAWARNRDGVARFLREARTAARLRHPNIVPVYDADGAGTQPYIVSQFVAGKTLRATLEADKQASLDEHLRLIAKLAAALHYAHQSGVVHRDLKPENIMIDEQGEPQVMDFGLARDLEGDELQTQSGWKMGTIAYMSPEQVRGDSHKADQRSDLWSLGVIMYELLTCVRPFSGSGGAAIEDAIRNREPEPLHRRRPEIPRDVETICLRCLVKEPDERLKSCGQLAELLEMYLRGDAIPIRPISLGERFSRWRRRNPELALATGTAAGLLMLLTAGSLTAAVAFNRQSGKLSGLNKQLESTNKQLAASHAKLEATNTKLEDARKKLENDVEKKRAHEVTQFIQGVFRHGDPEVAGQNLTMVQLLDRGVADAEVRFANDPLTKAAIFDTLGMTYRGRGDMKQAKLLIEKALELRRQHSPPESLEVFESINDLATTYEENGEFERARQLYEENLRLREAYPVDDPQKLLTAKHNLAGIYIRLKRYQEAIPLLRDVLAEREKRPANEQQYTLATANSLALAYAYSGDNSQALQMTRDNWELMQEVLGPDHPRTHTAQSNYAINLQDSGKAKEAIPHMEAVVAARRKMLGDKHFETSDAISNLAVVYGHVGDWKRSAELSREAYDLQKSELGPSHPLFRKTVANWAAALAQQGENEEAKKRLEEALAGDESWRQGTISPQLFQVVGMLGAILARLNEAEEAAELLGRLVKAERLVYGPEHPLTMNASFNLADALRRAKRFTEAREEYESLIVSAEKKVPRDNAQLTLYHLELVQTCIAASDFTAAAVAQRRRIEFLEHIHGPDALETLRAQRELAIFLNNAGQAGAAAQLLQSLVPRFEKLLGTEHPETVQTLQSFGLTLQNLRKPVEAAAVFQDVLIRQTKILGADHRDVLTTASALATVLYEQKKLDEAEQVLAEAVAVRERKLPADHADLSEARRLLRTLRDLRQGKGADDLEKEWARSVQEHGVQHPESVEFFNRWQSLRIAEKGEAAAADLVLELQAKLNEKYGAANRRTVDFIRVAEQVFGRRQEIKPLVKLLTEQATLLESIKPADEKAAAELVYAGNVIGVALGRLGQFEPSLKVLTRNCEVGKEHLGPGNKETLTAARNLATTYYFAKQPEKAIPLFEETLPLHRKALGENDPATMECINNAGAAYFSANQIDKAAELFRQAFTLHLKQHGVSHRDTISSGTNLIAVLEKAGQKKEADAVRETLKPR